MPLYKYVSIPAALRFFETFTQPAEFNDPFELRPHVRGLADEEMISAQQAIAFQPQPLETEVAGATDKLQLSALDRSKIDVDELVNALRGTGDEVFKFVKNSSDALGPVLATHMSGLFNDNLGIFCLTKDPMNLLM